ncbi:MAG TPA: hypothetical protein VKV23_04055 [Acidimicrobiales bacterium]|nr:hypothetical protein [Acidimicrobiales bacterium]
MLGRPSRVARERALAPARPGGASRPGALARGASRFVAAGTLGALLATAGGSPARAGASIGSDHSRIAQLERRIAAEGSRIQTLVTRYDEVQAELALIDAQVARDRAALSADRRAEARTRTRLRRVAVDAYVNAATGSSSPFSAYTNTSSGVVLAEQQVYLGVASNQLDSAMNALQLAEHRTAIDEATLRSREAAARQALDQLAVDRSAAQAGVAAEQATLARVNANLLALVTAARLREQQRQDAAAEQALAAQAAAQASASPQNAPPRPAPVASAPPAPAGYANPLRALQGLASERIDQGVDYAGFGPIYALGDGIVLSTYNGGWPGGTFITYRLTDGPAAGLIVYAAEDIDPSVSIGERVTPRTVLGQVYEGSTGIEVGWAASTDGVTMAAAYGQYASGGSTAFGYNFSQLLQSLGAPGGIPQTGPIGSLPPTWPQW